MARAKEYANAAARQEAYRARQREREPPRQGMLAALARTLHGELQETAEAGKSPLPPELIGSRADETLRNVIGYLRGLREEGDTARVRAEERGGEKETQRS